MLSNDLIFEIVFAVVCVVVGCGVGFIVAGKTHKKQSTSNISKSIFGSYLNKYEDTGSKASIVPKHIAVIMDGNRRFGRKKHSDPLQGHWAGGQTLIDFVQWCMEDGVEILTVYAFSTENWSRDSTEVSTLMTIFAKYANNFQKEALSRNIKVDVLSTDFDKLPPAVRHSVEELRRVTSECTGLRMNICLSYGGRMEIVQACKNISSDVADDKIKIESIDEKLISSHLLTNKSEHDPDILIRTSGEHRISNFLLWQIAYSEMFFIDKYWPEVTQSDLRAILLDYAHNRQRRFGV